MNFNSVFYDFGEEQKVQCKIILNTILYMDSLIVL